MFILFSKNLSALDKQGVSIPYLKTKKYNHILMANNLLPIQNKNGERAFFNSEPVQFHNNIDTVDCIKLIEISEIENPDYLNIFSNISSNSINYWIRTEQVIGYISIDGILYVD